MKTFGLSLFILLTSLISRVSFSAEHAGIVSTYSCRVSESSDRLNLVKIVTAVQYQEVNNVLNHYRHHSVTEVPVAEGLSADQCLNFAVQMENINSDK